MKTIRVNEEEYAALQVLRSTGVNILEAAIIAREALRVGRGKAQRARACIEAGAEELRKREQTVTFARAVEEALEARNHRRKRTLMDFRYICRRLLKRCKELAKMRMRSMTPKDCAACLHQAFDTPRQRNKARLILSGIFSTAVKRGWCSDNPVSQVEVEQVEEKRIRILSEEEIARLLKTAREYENGSCLAAVGMMLYAGIRPHEVERLSWKDVQVDAGIIYISPRHSKTGGSRHVTIYPPLKRLLSSIQEAPGERICPSGWRRLWAGLHKAAGFDRWQPDVLRHTFATHHLSTFRNYAELQLEMGHRSADLLRSRYVAMDGLSRRGESLLAE